MKEKNNESQSDAANFRNAANPSQKYTGLI